MLKRTLLYMAAVAMAFSLGACDNGGSVLPSGNSGVAVTPESSGTQAATTPAAVPANSTSGIAVSLVSTTFEDGLCTKLNQPKYEGVTELTEVDLVTNNTAREVYARPAIFHSEKAGCGPTEENPGGLIGLMDAANIAPGASATWTHRFTVPKNACGRYQFDNEAMNGEISQSTPRGGVGGMVIDTGFDCPSCEATNVTLSVSGKGLTRTVKVTFKGQKGSKKATVDFGDGKKAELTSGASVQHTWPYGSYTVTAMLDTGELECSKSATVENEKPCDKYSELVLKADADDPHQGQSTFKYHVFRQVGSRDIFPGLGNDQLVWEGKLAKGVKKHISVPDNGAVYYAFYDGEIWYSGATTTATCSDVQAAWDPKLWFECGCRGDD